MSTIKRTIFITDPARRKGVVVPVNDAATIISELADVNDVARQESTTLAFTGTEYVAAPLAVSGDGLAGPAWLTGNVGAQHLLFWATAAATNVSANATITVQYGNVTGAIVSPLTDGPIFATGRVPVQSSNAAFSVTGVNCDVSSVTLTWLRVP